ncbi:hypothetical protein ZHAS_00006956 [Anopheles sinensis]|uniref:Uncharacterized protein n=1 Tax=Anopheles sinensis TaxID=74873 RepID=A0A084VNB9_ANOSI|nr:hypothetical protein ZHAS_00006956 [Anopheles sinensis]
MSTQGSSDQIRRVRDIPTGVWTESFTATGNPSRKTNPIVGVSADLVHAPFGDDDEESCIHTHTHRHITFLAPVVIDTRAHVFRVDVAASLTYQRWQTVLGIPGRTPLDHPDRDDTIKVNKTPQHNNDDDGDDYGADAPLLPTAKLSLPVCSRPQRVRTGRR